MKDLDLTFFEAYVARSHRNVDSSVNYQEPYLDGKPVTPYVNTNVANDKVMRTPSALKRICARVITLGDFIDTDAVSSLFRVFGDRVHGIPVLTR